MENIRQAIERAKGSGLGSQRAPNFSEPAVLQSHARPDLIAPTAPRQYAKSEITLDDAHLESKRVIAHDIADPRSKSFDMLRTQVLQAMELKSWHSIGVTSPTAGCGKTLVSVNLAMSIARQQTRPVLLVDLDLQKPQVANYLGLKCKDGILSILEGRAALPDAVIESQIKDERLPVLPCERSTLNSSEWMASKQMEGTIQQIKRDFNDCIVIFDLPPVLTGDDVITILPQLDCMLFVAAIGVTTISDLKESNKHLELASIVRFVLNRSSEMPATYYSRYAEIEQPRRKKRRA